MDEKAKKGYKNIHKAALKAIKFPFEHSYYIIEEIGIQIYYFNCDHEYEPKGLTKKVCDKCGKEVGGYEDMGM